MKTLLILLFSILQITGCAVADNPKNVVSQYLKAIDNFQFDKAKSLLIKDPENLKAFDNIRTFSESFNETKKRESILRAKNRVYNIIDKETTKDTALIIATNNEGSFTALITFEMIKQNGKWLIKSFKTDIG